MQNLRVLHVEDDLLDAELLANTLQDAGIACDILRVDAEPEFLNALRSREFDLIISDFSMPGFDGKSALRIARESHPDVPFIFLSGTIGEEAAVESLLSGATDYVLKHRFSRLVPAVERALREAHERREHKRSQEALRASEERYRMLFASNPHPMWVYDLETLRFLAVNEAAINQYGYTREEFLQMTVGDIHPGGDTHTRRHRKKNGVVIDVEIASHEFIFDGRAARLVSADDITEKKNIQAQLLRTQRMDSIGTLAGGIAHDLNNVLAPILMAVQVLKSKHADEGTLRMLETLENSAKRGAGIVRQVLTFARGVEGEHVPVQAKHLLANMEQMLNQTFPKSIRIQTEIPKNLWTVSGDPTQLDQVLLNLCVNARDAMPNGGMLRLRAENTILDDHYARLNLEAKAGPYVTIEVADTGQGMPPAIIDKIFEPFFTTKEVGKGTGLGLSTVTAIVKSHGGFVNVYSEVGKGTSFKVFLPAKESAETREAGHQLAELPLGRGELILVVDDEAAVREIAQVTLQSYGYRVLTANNGAEATACYAQRSKEIKLVLLDMVMPIMDGPAAIHALRAVNPDVRIVAASGLIDTAKSVSDGEQLSTVRAILSKPYTAEKLLTTLREVLSQPAVRTKSTRLPAP